MARKLTFEEMRAFHPPMDDPQELVADAETIERLLAEKRDQAMELSPESSLWFGDRIPGALGFHW